MDAKARVQDWQIIISEWQASGLSGMAFCKVNNHAYHKFSYWRRRLRPSTSSPVAQSDLRPAPHMPAIYLYPMPIDFRKQANSLAVLAEQSFGHSPFFGALYAFTNRQRNKIKCLMWEGNGFVLYLEKLERLLPWNRVKKLAESSQQG